jgi:hypothetical protein
MMDVVRGSDEEVKSKLTHSFAARRSPRRWRHPGQERADTRERAEAH